METPQLQFIEPLQLAERREELAGSVQVSSMQRLSQVVHSDSGKVDFHLQFGKDEQGINFIEGEFSVNLEILCQRCMEPMSLPINHSVKVAVVFDQTESENIPDHYEPLLLNDKHLALETLLEEEILLALPISPLHDPDMCSAGKVIEHHRPVKESPFAILKNLKPDK